MSASDPASSTSSASLSAAIKKMSSSDFQLLSTVIHPFCEN